uniref:Uncharacterized protein n=1 Tax=Opuntia streptacantha TaxID=393608 RepID=A0A7C8ZPV4_OPUST
MAQVLNLSLPHKPPLSLLSPATSNNSSHPRNFDALAAQLRYKSRFSCLFNNNRKQNCLKLNLLASDLTSVLSFSWYEWQEQAKKALESALGGNKEKFEKWNQEIKKREEVGGGGGAGGGGWFGWGGRFGWSHGDNFWQEAQQTILTLLGIVLLYLVVAKGDLLLAVIFNPLLSALRAPRDAFTCTMSRLTRKFYPASDAKLADAPMEPASSGAKSRVMKKWGSD